MNPARPYVARRPAAALERTSRLRAKVAFYAFALIGGFLIWRLYVVQIRQGPWLAHRAYEQRLRTVDLIARRGAIYDRNGVVLVRSIPSQSVYATTADVRDKPKTAQALAPLLGLPEPYVEKRLGARMDLRAFHDAILEEGHLPMSMLKERMNAWIDAQDK